MSYANWNDFFRNYHDDKKTGSNTENLMDDIDNLFNYNLKRIDAQ